eukprot:maker-scaffold_30-snap-gene-2.62-mRNA-1 protein AED:0.01 eAED:0.01 QI:191/1/1/1/1/1/3/740/254
MDFETEQEYNYFLCLSKESLLRYLKEFGLVYRKGADKSELANIVDLHFRNEEVSEEQCLEEIYTYLNKVDQSNNLGSENSQKANRRRRKTLDRPSQVDSDSSSNWTPRKGSRSHRSRGSSKNDINHEKVLKKRRRREYKKSIEPTKKKQRGGNRYIFREEDYDSTYGDNGKVTYNGMLTVTLKKMPNQEGVFEDICNYIEGKWSHLLNWKLDNDVKKNPVWRSSVRKILLSNERFRRVGTEGKVFTFSKKYYKM